MKKDIAVNIQNKVQFYSIKPYLDLLDKEKISYDIYIPYYNGNDGFNDIFDDLYNYLKESHYSIKRVSDKNIKYTILLEPYPMEYLLKQNAEFKIKYKYGPLSAKPNPVYLPESNLCYDAILCFGKYEAEYLKCFSETFIIENLKYKNFKKKKRIIGKDTKLHLLYLPTYGDQSSIIDVYPELLKLSNDYQITVKAHHGTSFLVSENQKIEKLQNLKNIKFCDLNTPIVELLENADVVLSDNSGSIFEAIYADIPVAICAKDINPNLGNFDSCQYLFVKEGIIPYTNLSTNIRKVIEEALSKSVIAKQRELKKRLFSNDKEIFGFINVINLFLNHQNNKRYKQLHDYFKEDYYNNLTTSNNLRTENEYLKKQNNELNINLNLVNNDLKLIKEKNEFLNTSLNYYRNGKLYKLANAIYKLKNKIFSR